MSESVSKRRKKLNAQQLEVLNLLYKFRFGTNDLFAQYFGKKDRSFAYKRLSILLEQGLVGKRFDGSYRLQGKPAAYYLTPEGARKLQEINGADINVRSIYKDKTVSEKFIAHSLELFAIRNCLYEQYGDDLLFFTRVTMNREEYDYFPRPLPDAYIRIRSSDKHFFLDVFHDSEPHFVPKRRTRQYIRYEEEGEWLVTETNLPVVLAVCGSSNLAMRVQKYMAVASDNTGSDNKVVFAFTTKDELRGSEPAIWRCADGSNEKHTLQTIS